MPTVGLSPLPKMRFEAVISGVYQPAVGYKLYTYITGTTTPKTSYTDSTGTVANANPIILDANGEANIWLDGIYRLVLKTDTGVQIYSVDGVSTNETLAILRVADVTGLLSGLGSILGQTVEVAGFHPSWSGTTTGPIGGGTFVWDSNKPKSNHNGGTIISPTVPWDGTQATLAAFLAGTGETTPAGNGCWVRLDNEPIDPIIFGARYDGTTNDYNSWLNAVAATVEGKALTISGSMYYTTAILLTKNIDIICQGDRSYFKPNTPGVEAFTFKPTSLRKVKMDLKMYGPASSCRNGFIFDKVTESDFRVSCVVGATSYGVQALGCLNTIFDIDISTNRSAPTGSSAAMPTKSLFIGASSDAVFKSCNGSRFKIYLGGGGQGVEGANANSEGDYVLEGTIEGNTGYALNLTGNNGLDIRNLHLESGLSTASSLTNCTNFKVGSGVQNLGTSATNTTINIAGCSGFAIDGYTGSLNIDSTSRNGELRNITLNSYDSVINNAISVQMAGQLNSNSSSSFSSGQLGEFNQENIFQNPFIDLWPNGTASAPQGFSGGGGGSTLTWAQEVGVTYGGNAGGANRKAAFASFTVAQPTLANSAKASITNEYASFNEETWYSVMTAVYVVAGQPNIDVYLFDGNTYNGLGTVAIKDAYVVLRGSAKFAANSSPAVVYRPAAVGSFLIGGLSIVRGANPPKHLSNHGKRENVISDNIGSTPGFVGQMAFVSATGKWYLAKGIASSADWIILN